MKNRKFDVQIFANDSAVRSYQPEFKELLQAVFKKQAYFADFFGGSIEALDGVQHNENAFYVKTSDIPVVFGEEYAKGENVAMGTGTSNTSRFGNRTEIIYTDTPVPYTWEWTFHEGIDRHTVNNDFDAAIADRLDLQAQAKTQRFDVKHSAFIAASAGSSETLTEYTADAVLALFNKLSKHFTNNHAIGERMVKVNSDLYNAVVDHPLNTTAKGATVDINGNEVTKFKGFTVQEVPEDVLEGNIAYAYIKGVGKAFTGINTARTVESEDFDGVALQGAGKAGEYIPECNKKAVVKIVGAGA